MHQGTSDARAVRSPGDELRRAAASEAETLNSEKRSFCASRQQSILWHRDFFLFGAGGGEGGRPRASFSFYHARAPSCKRRSS